MEKAPLRDWLRRLAPEIAHRLSQADSPSKSEATAVRDEAPSRAEPSVSEVSSVGEFSKEPSNLEEFAGTEDRNDPPTSEDLDTQPGDAMLLSVARPAMACEFEVLLNQNQYPSGAEEAVRALELIEELELLLSVYKPRSELSNVNRFGSQRPQPVSFDTLQVLQLAKAAHLWTGGAFDITAGSLSEVWGFSRREGKRPTDEQISEALQSVGSSQLSLSIDPAMVALNGENVRVNPGGIGKGYALDRAAGKLQRAGITDFMMHGGLSSIVARGNRRGESGWQVSLKHPWRWEEHLGTIRLENQALGTSGSGKQFFHFGGKRYSHIIDPRTGWPAQGMMSTTVICPSAAIADCLATALFVMGITDARRFCERHPEIGAIFVFQDENSGRQKMESLNLTPQHWQPR